MRWSRTARLSFPALMSALLLQGCIIANVKRGPVAVLTPVCDPNDGNEAFLKATRESLRAAPLPEIKLTWQQFLDEDANFWFDFGREHLPVYDERQSDELDLRSAEALSKILGVSSRNRIGEFFSVPADGADAALTTISKLYYAFPTYNTRTNEDTFSLPKPLHRPVDFAEITAKRGWDAALIASYGKLLALRYLGEDDPGIWTAREALSAMNDHRAVRFVSEYFSAYFKHGQIFRVELLTISARDELIAKLTEAIEDPDLVNEITEKLTEAFSSMLDRFCRGEDDDACVLLGVRSDASFVSRSGKTISFPGIVATVDPGGDKKVSTNKLDTEDIGHEMLEVLIEAVADAKYLVPGAPTSTACEKIKTFGDLCENETDKEKLSAVNESAARTEASARAAISVLVRGGGWFSLNNESLADWLETLIAVSARKVSEAAEWSKQSCGGEGALQTPDTFIELQL